MHAGAHLCIYFLFLTPYQTSLAPAGSPLSPSSPLWPA